jgi:GGDEF domain-containing protein
LPHRFEAVAEALASGSDSTEACRVVGRDLALDGASLDETLSALRETWRLVLGGDPAYDATSALLGAWSDATLAYLHQLSCEDPMTGLATLAHVRTRVSDLYREAPDPTAPGHTLVVCDLVPLDHGIADAFTRALVLTRLGEAARTVFAGRETIGRLGGRRVVAVVARDERLGARVRLLRSLLDDTRRDGYLVRAWIEGLPGSEAGAALLLDELARD